MQPEGVSGQSWRRDSEGRKGRGKEEWSGGWEGGRAIEESARHKQRDKTRTDSARSPSFSSQRHDPDTTSGQHATGLSTLGPRSPWPFSPLQRSSLQARQGSGSALTQR
eukprot:3542154-Rhodomonas_salina.5